MLLSSAKILEPGSKESKVKESSGKRLPLPMPAYPAGWWPRGEWAQRGKTCLSLSSRAGVKALVCDSSTGLLTQRPHSSKPLLTSRHPVLPLPSPRAYVRAKPEQPHSRGLSLHPWLSASAQSCMEPRSPSGFGTSQSGMSSAQSGGWEGPGLEPGPAAGSQAAACGLEQASQT